MLLFFFSFTSNPDDFFLRVTSLLLITLHLESLIDFKVQAVDSFRTNLSVQWNEGIYGRPVYYYVHHARWHMKASPSKGFAFQLLCDIRNGRARLLRSHEDVYSDPRRSFLCLLGLSTLLVPRMVFDRELCCSRLRLCPPRSDHQFRGATSHEEERLSRTRA